MGVFFVMVLVLLAGAVSCHGRTESLGTVFNRTQPHESMNNVTVSSSKLEAYGLLFLVMQWPSTFCHFNTCFRPAPAYFTVHGLWPQPVTYPFRLGINCRLIYGQYQRFNIRQLDGGLLRDLNKLWPDLNSSVFPPSPDNNNRWFWGREYNKHGSCTLNNQNWYFRRTLLMVQQLGALIVNPFGIRGGGFGSRSSYPLGYIKRAVLRATNKMPMLRCIKVRDFYYLYEIYFCAYGNSNQLVDCNWSSNCGNENHLVEIP